MRYKHSLQLLTVGLTITASVLFAETPDTNLFSVDIEPDDFARKNLHEVLNQQTSEPIFKDTDSDWEVSLDEKVIDIDPIDSIQKTNESNSHNPFNRNHPQKGLEVFSIDESQPFVPKNPLQEITAKYIDEDTTDNPVVQEKEWSLEQPPKNKTR